MVASSRTPFAKTKVRTGCLTCKYVKIRCRIAPQANAIFHRYRYRTATFPCKSTNAQSFRRIKCDEQKPSCAQCVRTKRVCEGYPFVHQPISSTPLLSDDEARRAFLFFRARTTRRIFGQQDADEWIALLLQLGYVETPVKHAIIALASLHESLEPLGDFVLSRKLPAQINNAAQILAWKHYGKAIKPLATDAFDIYIRPDISMLMCILFVCFEQMQTGDAACIVHLTAGLKLLRWWRSCTNCYNRLKSFSKPTSEIVNEMVTPVMQRLRVQFGLCMDIRHTRQVVIGSACLPAPSIPPTYASLNAARKDFDRAMNYVFTTLECSRATRESKMVQGLIRLLQTWKQAVDSTKFCVRDDAFQRCTFKLLELYYHVSIIITNTFNAEAETVFDDYLQEFNLVVEYADDMIEEWRTTTQQYNLLFSFDLGIAPPMFLVASRCRHPGIRRKALRLMIDSPFYHGIWRDHYSGICAQRIIDIEEQDIDRKGFCDSDILIPENKRIRKISADLDEEHERIVMKFIRSPFTSDSEVCTTTIPLYA